MTIRAVPFGGLLYQLLLGGFIALALAAVVLKITSGKFDAPLKKRLARLSSFCLAASIVGLIILFFNYERAAVIGSRIWFLIAGVGFAAWLGFILYDIFVKLPKEKSELKTKEKFTKYLPQNNTKNRE